MCYVTISVTLKFGFLVIPVFECDCNFSEITPSVILRKWQTRFLLVDIVVLGVFLPHIWKKNFGMKLLVERQKLLNMHVMLMAVPFLLLPLISLEIANGI